MLNIEFINPNGEATSGGAVNSVNGKTGDVVLTAGDVGATTQAYVDNAISLLDIPNVENLATKAYVDAEIKNVNVEVDLTNYATKIYVDNKVENGIANHTHAQYPTKVWVQAQLDKVEQPDLSNYASKIYVENAINAIPATDLSNYYTKEQTQKQIDELGATVSKTYPTYAETFQYVGEKIAEAQLSGDGEVDLSGYATKLEVEQAHADFYTKSEVDRKIADIDIPEAEVDLSNYYTKAQTDTAISTAIGNIEIPEASQPADLSNYYTKQEIENKGYYTEVDVNDAIANAIIAGVEVKEICVSTTEPTDTNALIWIIPDGETTSSIATVDYVDDVVKDMATTSYVEELIGGVENGSY